ncbi:MAG: GAF domain-containing protein, partial [Burkholderiaceae bacterium]
MAFARKQTSPRKPTVPKGAAAGTLSIEAVAALARHGRHPEAIKRATLALETARGEIEDCMSLLEVRLESHIAVGQIGAADADAVAMASLADKAKSAAITARALIGRARVRIRRDNKEALTLATAAAKAAAQSKQAWIIAQSLRLLAHAQAQTGDHDAALANARKAFEIFDRLGDVAGRGRALWVVGLVGVLARRFNEAGAAVAAALLASREVGDAFDEGNALNLLSQTGADIAAAMRLRHEAAEAFGRAGYVEQRTMMVGNLATSYHELGLYHHACRLQGEVAETARAIGARGLLTYALGNQLDAEIRLGLIETATTRLAEFAVQVPELGDRNIEVQLEISRGDLALAAGDAESAALHYGAGVKIARSAGLGAETSCHALVSQARLGAGDANGALRASAKAVALHRAQHFAAPDVLSSQEIWWRHSQALGANRQSTKARAALERAYGFLLDGIANLRDEGLRRSYLNKVTANREILAAWLADATACKLPRERILAHLAIESNVREPFKRLADTGLRLNTLRTDTEIRRFIVEEATELSGGERVVLVLERDGKREAPDALVPRGEDSRKLLRAIEPYLARAAAARTAVLVHTPASAAQAKQRSRIVAPLEAQGTPIGYLYVDMDGLYGRFDDADRDMMGLLANQAAVVLDNAQWSQGLERKVAERTAELQSSNALLEQRADELAIINSIQQGIAAELDFQAIVDLVGDKLRGVFATPDLAINWYDEAANLLHPIYSYEHGRRLAIEPYRPNPGGMFETLRRTRRPLLLNEAAAYASLGVLAVPGTDTSKSLISVPIVSGDRVLGNISIENYERENSYGASELGLLTTIAASLGTALENARLFAETQRLLKETEQRAAELAVINSIQ